MKDLEGKVALITGGSRGIGRALCVQLTALGAHVYACARDIESLKETEALCGEGASFTGVQADVTDPSAVKRLIERIADERGKLDILVNNAAILGPRKNLEDVALEDWQKTQRINVDGVFIVSTQSIALLREADQSVMINVSSSVGRRGRGGWGPYAVSKHGVEGITETLADELESDGVCVVSINPGGTATDMRQEAYPSEDPNTLPSAESIASTFVLLMQKLDMGQTGRKYDARALLDRVEGAENASEEGDLPFVS